MMSRDNSRFVIEIIAIILVIIGLCLTYSQLKQNEKLSRDTYLTGLWNEIMRESIKYPKFQDRAKTSIYKEVFTPKEQIEYAIYARWIGGFVEDLYYHNYKKEGLSFFEPSISTFLQMHCEWFLENIEYYKYTDEFYERLGHMKCKPNRINKLE